MDDFTNRWFASLPLQHSTTFQPLTLQGSDGESFSAWLWLPDSPRGAVHILHGMAEHAGRYAELISHLVNNRIAVIVHNHRGHGDRTTQGLGHFGHQSVPDNGEGWQALAGDAQSAHQHLLSVIMPDCPIFLLGHSMGSFLARFLVQHGSLSLQGLVLSGSTQTPLMLCRLGQAVSRLLMRVQGQSHPSRVLSTLAFAGYNRGIRPRHSEFDWLSRDSQRVSDYLDDPSCGFLCTTGFWNDFFWGLQATNHRHAFAEIPDELPILLLSGDQDPVGLYGKGVRQLATSLSHNRRVAPTTRLYPGGRHEMFNETNRSDVFHDLSDWLNQHMNSVS